MEIFIVGNKTMEGGVTIEMIYCRHCGEKLRHWRTIEGYGRDDGETLYTQHYKCPNIHWWHPLLFLGGTPHDDRDRFANGVWHSRGGTWGY